MHLGVIGIRKLLAVGFNFIILAKPPIQVIIDSEVVPTIIQFLSYD